MAVFLALEARSRSPLLPLGILRLRNVATSNVVGVLWAAAMFAWFFVSALYLQLVLGYSPLQVGLAFLPANLIMAAFSIGLSAKLVMRFGIRAPLAAGLLLASIGLVLFARAPVDGAFLVDVLPSMILLGFGAGMAFNPVLLAAMSDVDQSEAGLASGVVNTSFMMGGALGLAVLASLAASQDGQPARLRGRPAGRAQRRLPPGVPRRGRVRRAGGRDRGRVHPGGRSRPARSGRRARRARGRRSRLRREARDWHAGLMERELAIRLRGVHKRYGDITAVDGLDLDVPVGTCVGLLGPNGAGKSTTMRLLTAQSIADEGELEVLGYKLPEESKQARALCGVAPQLDNLDTTLTVEQNLLVFTHLYRIPRSERKAAIERALVMAKLVDRRDSRVDKLSGGMRRRLLISRALVHRPQLVLLDEPTVGLDPQVRQELWALIDALRSEGTTILMSTHYIEEAQRLADTVLIMSHGSAVAAGPPPELVLEHAGEEVLEVYGPPARLAEVEEEAGAAGMRTRRTGTSISILGVDGGNGFQAHGERRPANLEDVFVLLTGEEIG